MDSGDRVSWDVTETLFESSGKQVEILKSCLHRAFTSEHARALTCVRISGSVWARMGSPARLNSSLTGRCHVHIYM